MKLLVIKTSSLGDVIHMLPAVTDAAKSLANLRVDWLVEESFAAIPSWHPCVERVITVAMRRWKKQWAQRQSWREMAAAKTLLQTQRYDAVLDSQGLLKSALWCRLAQGSRIGYDRHSAREPLAAWFYSRKITVPRELHAIERNRQLMATALGYNLDQPQPDYGLQGLAERLKAPDDLHLPPASIVGLHGTSRADKLWPVTHWKFLANALAQQSITLVLPWGNAPEHERAREIAREQPNVIVLPRLGLDALASIIGQARAVVGVDTGLLHLAAALGKPGLALYTSTPPALTGAVSDRQAQHTLRNLSTPQELQAQQVFEALMTTWQ